jgi:hypothetical protein
MIARTTAQIGLPVTNSPPAEDSTQLSLGRYLSGGLLVTESSIYAIVRAIIGSISLLVDY